MLDIKGIQIGVRLRLAVAFVSLLSHFAFCEPVSADLAKRAVTTWLSARSNLGTRQGKEVESVRFCSTNGATFYVASLSSGGFVVTSGDTEIEPIIAFSNVGRFEESESNPLWELLIGDLASRCTYVNEVQTNGLLSSNGGTRRKSNSSGSTKWSCLAASRPKMNLLSTPRYGEDDDVAPEGSFVIISDVRVEPLLGSVWGQTSDLSNSEGGDICYNYYTPSNYPCGCVATAGAQIMRYHRFPSAENDIEAKMFTCQLEIETDPSYTVHENIELRMQGGCYAWHDMPLVPSQGTTLAQRQAIGKLMSDVGIACRMEYGMSGSGANGYMLLDALTNAFGYANGVATMYKKRGCAASVFASAVLPNLDARLPVAVFVNGCFRHAIVADGYGYLNDTMYIHFNMGWNGDADAWYSPPDLGYFDKIEGFVCNIYPEGAHGGVICSGRVLSRDTYEPVVGVVVSALKSGGARTSCITDDNGIYALILEPGEHTISVPSICGNCSFNVALEPNVSLSFSEEGFSFYPAPVVNNLFGKDFYVDVALPDLGAKPSNEVVASVLEDGGANDGLIKNINGRNYADFRRWTDYIAHSNNEQITVTDTLASPLAWLSYACGRGGLLQKGPRDADIKIVGYEAVDMDKYRISVQVKNIQIGAAALSENLERVFEPQGGTLTSGFSSDNVNMKIDRSEDGIAQILCWPKTKPAGHFLMRVKMSY